MFPHLRSVSYRAAPWVYQHRNHLIRGHIKAAFKTEHEVSQESLEGGKTRVTEKLTSTATPWPLQQDPERVIICYFELTQALFFVVDP